ncbi:MAG TPA: N-acylneuraminate-9-phosphate synthase [Candidatus Omnitrophica bacterium]|nr:N-acylneuraminate-9-phosphate synthase [Candidatus Omnitrophota bacterium]
MKLRIANRAIGGECPCFIVAEAGVNHNGSPECAGALIDMAAKCHVDAIKFQRRNVDSILTRAELDTPYVNERSFGATYEAHRRALELPAGAWPALKERAEKRGLLFFATPYDIGSADFLADLGVPAVKVASCDVTNTPLLDHVARMGVPVILSTGMSEEDEIDHAVRTVWRHTHDLVLMNCVSAYPAAHAELNLRYMRRLSKRFATLVGHSGHEEGIATSIAAVALGASVVERHLTLDRAAKGPDHAASLEPEGLRHLVRDIRDVEAAMKEHPKRVLDSEKPIRARLAKSLVTARPIGAGDVIERSSLCLKSPGTGLSPLLMDRVIGHHATRAIPADVLLRDDMFR